MPRGMTRHRLIVYGGRPFHDAAFLNATLSRVLAKHEIECVIEGECPTRVNADKLARRWAGANGILVVACPVDRALDGPWPGAGPRRNARMLAEHRPTAGVEFPGGRGTKDMGRRLREAGVGVWRVDGKPDTLVSIPLTMGD